MKFVVQLTFNAVLDTVVEAEDEGEALDKARENAEKADIRQFYLFGEQNARVVHRED
jgi:hypothetical protein